MRVRRVRRSLPRRSIVGAVLSAFAAYAAAQQSAQAPAPAASASALSPSSAASGAAQTETLDTIYVTAQQRKQRLQDVPMSVTAVPGKFIEENHIESFSDLAKVTPGLVSGGNYGFIRNSSMRGISNNQFGFADDPSIAMFVDSVYQGRGGTGSQVNALYDIDRVEIIKGPQASLFGRSSIGGAISIITNQPLLDQFEANAMFGLGNYRREIARGAVNIPLAPKFAVRVAVDSEDQAGTIRNTNGGDRLQPLNVKAGRILARYDGIDNLDVNLKLGHETRKQSGAVYQADGLPDFTTSTTLQGSADKSDFNINDAVLDIRYAVTPALTLQSVTSYRGVRNAYAEDYDGVPQVIGGPYVQNSNDRLAQQDLKFTFTGPSKLSVVGGASFFHENLGAFVGNSVDGNPGFTGFAFTGVPTPGLLPNDYTNAFLETGNFTGTFSGHSIFGDATFSPIDKLSVTGGVRFNSDTKRYTQDIPDPSGLAANAGKSFAGAYYNWGYYTSAPITSEKTWDDTSFRAALSYEVDRDMTTYLQWSQGWKAGGIDSFKVSAPPTFNLFYGLDATAVGAKPNVYDPEKSDSYEGGIKGKVAGGKLIYALALYRYLYRDLQVSVPQGGSSVIANVGKARGTGVETELRARPTADWDLFANLGYNQTRILSFPQLPAQEGLPLNQAPRITSAAGATYSFALPVMPGRLSLGGKVSYRSKYRNDNQLTEGVASATLVDVRAGWTSPDGRYAVALFADNLFDRFTYSRYNPATPFLFPVSSRSVIGDPRMVGVDFNVNF